MVWNYCKRYHKGTQLDLSETCEIIAWYILGAKNKDIISAYCINRVSLDGLLTRYHVPRKASNEHRRAIGRASVNAWRFRQQCTDVGEALPSHQ